FGNELSPAFFRTALRVSDVAPQGDGGWVVPRERLAREGKLGKDVIAVRVDGKVRDLMTPVPANAPLEVIRETDDEGLDVIRHSIAHVMVDAVQRLFPGTKVTIGPAIEDGF